MNQQGMGLMSQHNAAKKNEAVDMEDNANGTDKKNGKKYEVEVSPELAIPLPDNLGNLLNKLQELVKMPVWLLVQDGDEEILLGTLDRDVKDIFVSRVHDLPDQKPIALIIDSPGGDARRAYQIAILLQKRCGTFTAIIPRYAKSAATLLSLGANRIILGKYAELGPLDTQIMDLEREERRSALDEVQSLERLQAFALEAVDQAMFLLVGRMGKTTTTLLPHVLTYITHMMRPLLEKIDTVHYTQSSRILKVAEEYATRLLERTGFPKAKAETIARTLVESYPEHGFVIDPIEAQNIGLKIEEPDEKLSEILDNLYLCLNDIDYPLIGSIREAQDDGKDST